MQSVSINSRFRRGALLGLFVLSYALSAASPASAQTVPNDVRILRHIQPRAQQALHKMRMSKAAVEDAVILDQRWMYEWTGDRWQHIAQTLYRYQQADRTEEWQFVWNGFALVNQSRTTYTVADHRTFSELYEEWDPTTTRFYEVDRYTYSYYYDLFSGKPVGVETTHETKVGDAWQKVERTTYVKQSDGLMTGGTDEWAGEAWSTRSRFRLEQSGDSLIQIDEEWMGDAWSPTTRTTFYGYTIDELRDRTEEYLAQFMDYGGLLYSAHLFPNYSVDAWNGAAWEPSERKTSIVMAPDVTNGLWFSGSAYEVYDGSNFVTSLRTITTHRNADNKPVRAMMDMWMGTEFVPTLSETYEHDGRGDMIRATQQVDAGMGLENSLQFVLLWEHISVGTEDEELPGGYALDAAYPNPFNPSTSITYRLAAPGNVAIRAFDALGRHVATLFDGTQPAGSHEVAFDAADLPSGSYLIRLEAPGFQQTRTVTLLK